MGLGDFFGFFIHGYIILLYEYSVGTGRVVVVVVIILFYFWFRCRDH